MNWQLMPGSRADMALRNAILVLAGVVMATVFWLVVPFQPSQFMSRDNLELISPTTAEVLAGNLASLQARNDRLEREIRARQERLAAMELEPEQDWSGAFGPLLGSNAQVARGFANANALQSALAQANVERRALETQMAAQNAAQTPDPKSVSAALTAFQNQLSQGAFGLYVRDPMVQFEREAVGLMLFDDPSQPVPQTAQSALSSQTLSLVGTSFPTYWFDVMVAELIVDEDDFALHSPARRTFQVREDGIPDEVYWAVTPQRPGPLTLTLQLGVDAARFTGQTGLPPPSDIIRTVTVRAESVSVSKVVQYARDNWRELLRWCAAGIAATLGGAVAWVLGRWAKARFFPDPPSEAVGIDATLRVAEPVTPSDPAQPVRGSSGSDRE